ncbi:MAG: hypothetical protein WCI20_00030 [bacterium]
MGFELIFTSVPKGLKPGSRGFASVAFTEGMPSNYVQICESLSGYVHIFGPQESDYIKNPIAFSHLVTSVGGRPFSILSRVASYGTDYTGRTNKLAHHIMLGPDERTVQGPAVLMNGKGLFQEEWSEQPHFLPTNRIVLPTGDIDSLKAATWERMTGDAGNAGRLAQAFLDAPSKPSFIIFDPGMNIMPLIAEAQALLPIPRRWDLSFSTYFTSIPVGMDCAWRCCLPDSDALKVARRTQGTLVVDLTTRQITGPLSTTTTLIEVARTGTQVKPAAQITLNNDLPLKIRPVAKPIANVEASRSQPAGSAKQIRVNYGEALRPRPPKKDAPKRKGLWITAAAGFAVASLLIYGLYEKLSNQHPARGSSDIKPTDTNTLQSSSPPAIVSNADSSSTDIPRQKASETLTVAYVNTNAQHLSSSSTNTQKNDKSLNDSKQQNTPDLTNHKKEKVTETANTHAIIIPPQLVVLLQGSKYIPLTEDPLFYSASGDIFEHELVHGIAIEWSYKNKNGSKESLATKLMKPERLCDFSSQVQLVELRNTNKVYIINSFSASIKPLDKATYSVCLQNNCVADKLAVCLLSKENLDKLKIEGAKENGPQASFTICNVATGDMPHVDVRIKNDVQRDLWVKNESKHETDLNALSNKVQILERDDSSLSEWSLKIAASVNSVKNAKKSKEANKTKLIEQSADKLKIDLEGARKCYLSIKDAPSIAWWTMDYMKDDKLVMKTATLLEGAGMFQDRVISKYREDIDLVKKRTENEMLTTKQVLEKEKKVPVKIIITCNDVRIINASTP